jgi:hypothetical protein
MNTDPKSNKPSASSEAKAAATPEPRPAADIEAKPGRVRSALELANTTSAHVQRLVAALILAICIALWIAIGSFGSTLNSEQFRYLLNVAAVRTIYDAPPDRALAANTPAAPATSSVSVPAGLGPDTDVGHTNDSLRLWSDLAQEPYRLAKPDGSGGPFNPDRVELVLHRFLGFSPGPLWLMMLALLTYSPTNLALLSCLAGLCGGAALYLGCAFPTDKYGRALALEAPFKVLVERGRSTDPFRQSVFFVRTLMRSLATGFVVYLVIVAGLLVITGSPFKLSGPDDYTRLGGSMSLFSFLLAFRPRLFFRIVDSLRQGAAAGSDDGGSPAAERPPARGPGPRIPGEAPRPQRPNPRLRRVGPGRPQQRHRAAQRQDERRDP